MPERVRDLSSGVPRFADVPLWGRATRSGERLCTGRRRDTAAKLQTSPTGPDFARDRALYEPGGSNPLRLPPHAKRSPRSSRGPLASHASSARRWAEWRPKQRRAAALPDRCAAPAPSAASPALRGLYGNA
jgi:hypothetical protein